MLEMNQIINKTNQFIEEYCQKDILGSVGQDFIYINFNDIVSFDIDIANNLLDNPDDIIKGFEVAINNLELPGKHKEIKVRFTNLLESRNVPISYLRSNHLDKFIRVEGTVRQKSTVRPNIAGATFECPTCGNIMKLVQTSNAFKEPTRCGCGRKGKFKLLSKAMIDAQRLWLEEPLDHLEGNAQPQKIGIHLYNDLTSTFSDQRTNPGSKLIINGMLRDIPIIKNNVEQVERELIIEANSIEYLESDYSDILITETDLKKFEEMSKDTNFFENIVKIYEPDVEGYGEVKLALILVLFGGVAIKRGSIITRIGDIHTLLIGDPGTAKTSLANFAMKIAPKARRSVGKGASGVGLTATVVKDDFLGTGWAVQAGALPLANHGLCVIDEMDKMNDEDRSHLNEAMSPPQTVSIDKANVHTTLKTETTVIGIANPRDGRFSDYSSIPDQFNFKADLLNRFSLVYIFRDKPMKEKDELITKKIFDVHKEVERKDIDDNIIFLRKYIAYAKQNFFPELNKACVSQLQNFYLELRDKTKDNFPIGARHLEALIQLAKASARARLSNIADEIDGKRSIEVMLSSLQNAAVDPETGSFDFGKAERGVSATNSIIRGFINSAYDFFEKQSNKPSVVMAIEEIENKVKEICEQNGQEFRKDLFENVFEQMNRYGDLWMPKPGFYGRSR